MASRLEALPKELIFTILELIIPTRERVSIHYTPQETSREALQDARTLMLLNKHFNLQTTQLLYGQNTFLFADPHNTLPLFLVNLREKTLRRSWPKVFGDTGTPVTVLTVLLSACA